MRAFVAIDISEEVRRKLVEAQRKLQATGAELKLVEPQNIHVTVKFLGEVPEPKIAEIAEALRKAAEGMSAFDMRVTGVGVFPNLRRVRVVWVGVTDGREQAVALIRGADRELQRLGFAPEREYVPHLTLARVKSGVAKERLVEAIKGMAGEEFGVTRVQALELKRSTLTPKGPIYTTLARAELKP